jgi:tetratricopeptide (TPR) repeat protein
MADKRVALLKRANKLFRQGKAEAAIKEYNKILALKPDDLEVRRIVGDLQLRENNLPGAIEQFEWIADHYLKEGFFAKAIAMFKRITRVDPNYEGALVKLAELYTKQGLVMEAKQIYLDIAEECKRQNNQKKALDMYKKILEFDRGNIKMRLLLADNYWKEGLKDNAIDQYTTAADILFQKKDFNRAEELLVNTLKKTKHIRITERLIRLYATQDQDQKAMQILQSLGDALYENKELLKFMGEFYLKKNRMDEAEKIFIKIAQLDPGETEVIMRLGKVYIQREEYEKTFKLFTPIIDKHIGEKKYEEGANLLRFIIASNNSFLPALTKLASIFKLSGKTNNLIALYESLIPVYEQKSMKEQLEKVLEELIQLSDTPFSYEEQLARLKGQQAVEAEQEEQEKQTEREKEFVSYNLRVVGEALDLHEFDKAIEILKKAKTGFPKNVEIRDKLFEVYMQADQNEAAVEEGKGLLELYKFLGKNIEYSDMVEKLSRLRPHDDSLVALSTDEKTSIDIDFDRDALQEQIQEINATEMHEGEGDDDVLLLSEADNVTSSPLRSVVEAEIASKEDSSKSLSSVLSEVDFYVNDGYFGDAEKLVDELKQKYPGNKALLAKIKKLDQAKQEAENRGEASFSGSDFEIEGAVGAGAPPPAGERERTEQIRVPPEEEEFVIERSTPGVPSGDGIFQRDQDSKVEIDLAGLDMGGAAAGGEESSSLKLSDDEFFGTPVSLEPVVQAEPPPEPVREKSASDVFELETFAAHSDHVYSEDSRVEIDLGGMDIEEGADDSEPLSLGGLDMSDSEPTLLEPEMIEPEPPAAPPDSEPESLSGLDFGPVPDFPPEAEEQPLVLEPEESAPPPVDDNLFEIESSIAEESAVVQEHEDSKLNVKVSPDELVKAPDRKDDAFEAMEEEGDLEIELEEPEDTSGVAEMEIDKDTLVQSPSVEASREAPDARSHSASGIDEIDLDSIMEMGKEESSYDLDSPFKEDMSGTEMAFESEEDLLQGEGLFLDDDAYLEVENNVQGELEAIAHWLKELEKQRTSTIEKNMMEIFEEFKRGVDEKIGQEDYDTRYNLGIAYKEMGLLEEAIHEFLISSKHPAKFFDSAGLLGMCFRDKGMFDEALGWFEKALETPDRRKEEYLAIRFEMVITLKLKEEYAQALKILAEIIKVDSSFRNVAELYKELRGQVSPPQPQL